MKEYFILFLVTSVLFASNEPLKLTPEYFNECVPCTEKMRKSSFPLITGDTFRSLCDHKIDECCEDFYPENVLKGDIIYVTPPGLKVFFESMHPKILEPYILLTHNSDDSFPEAFEIYLNDEKLAYWFTTNNSLPLHQKMVSIPIGIANAYWPHGNKDVFLDVMGQEVEKKHMLIMNFETQTNSQKRLPILKNFAKKNFCYNPPKKKLQPYLLDMKSSYFVLSPVGNGLDCHRTWEALLLGTVPIVESTTLNSMYKDLPVLIVDDLKNVNLELLKEKLVEFFDQEFVMKKTQMNYWKIVLDEKKNEVISRSSSFNDAQSN
jgi:hypothetical protein